MPGNRVSLKGLRIAKKKKREISGGSTIHDRVGEQDLQVFLPGIPSTMADPHVSSLSLDDAPFYSRSQLKKPFVVSPRNASRMKYTFGGDIYGTS